jgi:hypothetical protein
MFQKLAHGFLGFAAQVSLALRFFRRLQCAVETRLRLFSEPLLG